MSVDRTADVPVSGVDPRPSPDLQSLIVPSVSLDQPARTFLPLVAVWPNESVRSETIELL